MDLMGPLSDACVFSPPFFLDSAKAAEPQTLDPRSQAARTVKYLLLEILLEDCGRSATEPNTKEDLSTSAASHHFHGMLTARK